MPETNFTIVQGTLTITEAGNSVPYSGKLDNLSKFPVEDVIKKVLKNDCVKYLDRAAWTQFNQTLLRAIPTGGTSTSAVTLYTNGTVTGTNSSASLSSDGNTTRDPRRKNDALQTSVASAMPTIISV